MNWELLVAGLFISIAIVFSVRELRPVLVRVVAMQSGAVAIANIAATLMAARLSEREYMERVENLRASVEAGAKEYPGGAEAVKEWEIAQEMLREIDYREDSVREEWVELAVNLYNDALRVSERLPSD